MKIPTHFVLKIMQEIMKIDEEYSEYDSLSNRLGLTEGGIRTLNECAKPSLRPLEGCHLIENDMFTNMDRDSLINILESQGCTKVEL